VSEFEHTAAGPDETHEQRSARPSGPERAAPNLAALDGASLMLLQRTSGNEAVRRLIQRREAGSALLQRDDDKKPYAGPKPETPFEMTPEVKAEIHKLALAELKLLTSSTVNQAYTNFSTACLEAKSKLGAQQKAEQEAREKMIEFVFGAVGMMLGPVGKAMGESIASEAVKSKVVDAVSSKFGVTLPGRVVNGVPMPPIDINVVKWEVSELMTHVTPENATAVIEGAAGKVASTAKSFKVGGNPHQTAMSFVDALQDAAHASAAALQASIAAASDAGALMGVMGRFEQATPSVYRAEVDAKAQHFLEQVGRTTAGTHGVAEVDAWGKKRLCTYSVVTDNLFEGTTYYFESWVTPDMEETVRALNPQPMQLKPGDFQNRVPEPSVEAAHGTQYMDQPTVVRMDAYGKIRLALVKAPTGVFDTKGSLKFVRWISAQEEHEQLARGESQMHGIPQIDPARIDGHIPAP
jgi:hypothetical protein